MVSTRQHPEEYYPSSGNDNGIARSASKGSSTAGKKAGHTPSTITLLWLLFAIPLVLWDTVYVLLRPHTMPGGKLHSPFFKPYALYGSVDYTYGWPAYKSGHGFPAGQGLMNLFETLAYIFYVTTVYRYGTTATGSGRASTKNVRKGLTWLLFEEKVVGGRVGSLAVLIAFSASVATFSKTVLYWVMEAFAHFDNVGHNPLFRLIFLWVVPNGLWLVFPGYMMYVFGQEILSALESAPPRPKAGRSKEA
ncbi:hypothetical protein VTN49DRAFT_1772 [Thermomyces lanuginosus]|uniref:uncharacterized protein n=1 Tax=Thermomyces lanuginosus TaxID=5541 RepID=UPI0037447AD7